MEWKNRIQKWVERNQYDIIGWIICLVLVGLSVYSIYTMFQENQNEEPAIKIEMENLNPEIEKENVIVTLEPIEVTPSSEIEIINPPALIDAVYYPLTDEERKLIEGMVTNEAGNQPYNGKVAVANCILNAMLADGYTAAQVKAQYGYSYYDIGKFESECLVAYGNTKLSDEVHQAVSQVFDDGKILSDNIFWFYNPSYCYSSFHENMRYQFTIGQHKFFGKW